MSWALTFHIQPANTPGDVDLAFANQKMPPNLVSQEQHQFRDALSSAKNLLLNESLAVFPCPDGFSVQLTGHAAKDGNKGGDTIGIYVFKF